MVRFVDKNESKSVFLLVLFYLTLQEITVDIQVFLKTEAVPAHKHASHISQFNRI